MCRHDRRRSVPARRVYPLHDNELRHQLIDDGRRSRRRTSWTLAARMMAASDFATARALIASNHHRVGDGDAPLSALDGLGGDPGRDLVGLVLGFRLEWW